MSGVRFFAGSVVMALGLLIPAPLAHAQASPCGAGGAEGELPEGTLVLTKDQSVTDLNFGRDTDMLRITLVYQVENCSLASASGVSVRPIAAPAPGGGQIPREAFKDVEIEAKRSLLIVEIPVDPTAFRPGAYAESIVITGDSIVPTSDKITIERNEHRLWIPALIWILGTLLGFGVAIVTSIAGRTRPGRVQIKWGWGVLALIGGFAASVTVVKTTYLDPTFWRVDPVSVVLFSIGVATAAAGGSVVAQVKRAIE